MPCCLASCDGRISLIEQSLLLGFFGCVSRPLFRFVVFVDGDYLVSVDGCAVCIVGMCYVETLRLFQDPEASASGSSRLGFALPG